jgi:hypothetical protein
MPPEKARMSMRAARVVGLVVAAALFVTPPARAEKRITEAEALAAIRAADERCRQSASSEERSKIWKALVKELRGRKIDVTDAPVSGFVSWLKWVAPTPDEGHCAPVPGKASTFSQQAAIDSQYEMFDLAPEQVASDAHHLAKRNSVGITISRRAEGQVFDWVLVLPPWAAREVGGAGASMQRGQRVAFECYPVLVSTTSMLCKVAGVDTRAR